VAAAERDGLPSRASGARIGLAAFVLAWVFDAFGLRAAVPIWLPFLIALALELHFFVGLPRLGPSRARRADRLPQAVDRERYGYGEEADELVLVREGGEELWVPYSGEAGEELDTLIEEARERARGGFPTVTSPSADRRGALRQLVAGLAVIGALAAVVAFVGSRDGWDGVDGERRAAAAQRFSAEASRIVGRPVTIHCDEAGDYVGAVQHADGVAAVGGRVAYLTPQRCYDLYRLAFRGEVTFSQSARALTVLAHEAWHLRGIRDEGTTECYALQSGVEIGRRLGLSEATARRMMQQQLVENTLRAGASAEYRVPPGCTNGGTLDLDQAESEFP
jgi:hypothetical protein